VCVATFYEGECPPACSALRADRRGCGRPGFGRELEAYSTAVGKGALGLLREQQWSYVRERERISRLECARVTVGRCVKLVVVLRFSPFHAVVFARTAGFARLVSVHLGNVACALLREGVWRRVVQRFGRRELPGLGSVRRVVFPAWSTRVEGPVCGCVSRVPLHGRLRPLCSASARGAWGWCRRFGPPHPPPYS